MKMKIHTIGIHKKVALAVGFFIHNETGKVYDMKKVTNSKNKKNENKEKKEIFEK